ncbi:MAG: hypothetical protein EAY81_09520 [Bacteroidetes bacterium]|nr:MAG: hypothetical protein EAY81_09520 [Bacteroidota bacterium]
MKKIIVLTFIVLTFAILLNSCKKQNEIEETVANDKWMLVPFNFFTQGGYFFEDRDGNIAYRHGETLYLFDEKGFLKTVQALNIPSNESSGFNFRRDGEILSKQRPFNSMSSDFIFYHKRHGPFSYSRPTMLDIRKLDSAGKYIAEYYIHDIFPNNLPTGLSNSGWIFASKYPDAISLHGNKNAQPVFIQMFDHNIGTEYDLPKDILYGRANSNSTHICLYAPATSKTFTFDRFLKLVGTQEKNSLVPNIIVVGNFVMKTTDGYYLSENAIQLKAKIPGLSNESKIFHAKDSLLHVYNNGSYSTVNAITGVKVFTFDTKSEKMPISIDTVHTVDYYRTKKGISYLVTSRGIVITN